MKLSYLITEFLPEGDFKIRHSNFRAKGCKIRIFRDHDYRLMFEVEIRGHEAFQDIRNGLNSRLRYNLTGIGEIPNKRLVIKNLIISQQSRKGDLYLLKGEAVRGVYYIVPKNQFSPLFKDFYYLNNLGHFFYTRSLEFKVTESVQFDLEGFSSLNHSFRGPTSSHRNLLLIKYDSKDIMVGSVDRGKKKHSLPRLFIRTRYTDGIPTAIITKLQEYLSFIGSGRLIYIGSAIISSEFTKFRHDYESTFSIGIANEMFRQRFSPLVFTRTPISREKIEAEIQQGFDAYLNKHSEFAFNQIISLISAAHIAPYELKIQPLAAAYDLLKSCWFRSKYSKSKGKNLQDDEFQPIIDKYIPLIEADLDSSKPTTLPILNRLKRANQMSLSEKDSVFFSELDLDIGGIEEFALGARHSIVHGNAETIDYIKIRNANTAYFTLVNRIVLRLLDFDEYLDHTYPSGHRQPKIKQKMLGPNMNGKL